MTDALSICVAVNKDNPTLGPSESFLRAHCEMLSGRVIPLVGSRTVRGIGLDSSRFVLSQSVAARAMRWAARKTGATSVANQDCRSIAGFLRREKIGVVLAEYGPTALDFVDPCALAGIPLVSHFHGWDAYVLARSAAQVEEYQQLFHRSAAIVAVSRHMREHLISLGAPADKVVWNPCGADPDAAVLAMPDRAGPVFVSIGRQAPKKATIVSLLAFAKVRTEMPNTRLVLVGGHFNDSMRQTLRALKLEDTVVLTGNLPHAQVLQVLSSARCYVHPSVTAPDGDMEGTPVSVLEAMAAALPVVASRHGGIVDVLGDTSAGILVEEYDVEATADAMLTYAQDPHRAAVDGLEGRRLLIDRWSMEKSISGLQKILELAHAGDATAIAHLAAAS